MKYNGPERLRSVTESVIRSTGERYGINFLRTNTPVEVSLSHHDISYEDLGFSDENEYFDRIDSLIAEIECISKIRKSASAKDAGRYQNNLFLKHLELRKLCDGYAARVWLEAKRRGMTLDEIDEMDEMEEEKMKILYSTSIGAYDSADDMVYLDPMLILRTFSDKEYGTILHELTHSETGNGKIDSRIRHYYNEALEDLQRVINGDIEDDENVKKIHEKASNLCAKVIGIGHKNIVESVAFAAEKNSAIPSNKLIDEKEFLKSRKIFSRLFNKYPYNVVTQMAKDVLDRSHEHEVYATHVLEDMAKEKESNDFDYGKLLWL